MVEVYPYLTKLPDGVSEIVAPGYEGYTIYIDNALSPDAQKRSFFHALKHIYCEDFSKSSVQEIESDAHMR